MEYHSCIFGHEIFEGRNQGHGTRVVTRGMLASATATDRSRSAPRTAQMPSASQSGVAPARPLRVLVVEDEAIIAMEIEMMLEAFGAEVVGVATTAAEAVGLASSLRPDCVTMDIKLKGERDGISAALEIREILGIRAIFVSAYGSDEVRMRAEPALPYGWIQKPIRTIDLTEALYRVSKGSKP